MFLVSRFLSCRGAPRLYNFDFFCANMVKAICLLAHYYKFPISSSNSFLKASTDWNLSFSAFSTMIF